jgi:hypothetical protein
MSTKSPTVAVFGGTDTVVNEALHVDDEEVMTERDAEMEQRSDASDASEEELGDEDCEHPTPFNPSWTVWSTDHLR